MEGDGWVTLPFASVPGKPQVKRTVKLFKIRGLSVEAVLGTDVLLARRTCAVELDDATFHGVMEIGPGEAKAVGMRLEHEDGELIKAAVRTALMLGTTRTKAGHRSTPRCEVRISRTPVLATLEEADVPGVVKPKAGPALVEICKDLTREQKEEMQKILATHRHAFANNIGEVGVAKGRWVIIDLSDKNPVTSGSTRRVPVHHRQALEMHIKELEKQKVTRGPLEIAVLQWGGDCPQARWAYTVV